MARLHEKADDKRKRESAESGGSRWVTHLGFDYLEVAHLDATRREVRNLELDADWPLPFARLCATHASPESSRHAAPVLIVAFHRGQSQFRPHEELFTPSELLDFPDDGRLLRCVVNGSNAGSETRRVRIFGHRNKDLDVVCRRSSLKLRSCLRDGVRQKHLILQTLNHIW